MKHSTDLMARCLLDVVKQFASNTPDNVENNSTRTASDKLLARELEATRKAAQKFGIPVTTLRRWYQRDGVKKVVHDLAEGRGRAEGDERGGGDDALLQLMEALRASHKKQGGCRGPILVLAELNQIAIALKRYPRCTAKEVRELLLGGGVPRMDLTPSEAHPIWPIAKLYKDALKVDLVQVGEQLRLHLRDHLGERALPRGYSRAAYAAIIDKLSELGVTELPERPSTTSTDQMHKEMHTLISRMVDGLDVDQQIRQMKDHCDRMQTLHESYKEANPVWHDRRDAEYIGSAQKYAVFARVGEKNGGNNEEEDGHDDDDEDGDDEEENGNSSVEWKQHHPRLRSSSPAFAQFLKVLYASEHVKTEPLPTGKHQKLSQDIRARFKRQRPAEVSLSTTEDYALFRLIMVSEATLQRAIERAGMSRVTLQARDPMLYERASDGRSREIEMEMYKKWRDTINNSETAFLNYIFFDESTFDTSDRELSGWGVPGVQNTVLAPKTGEHVKFHVALGLVGKRGETRGTPFFHARAEPKANISDTYGALIDSWEFPIDGVPQREQYVLQQLQDDLDAICGLKLTKAERKKWDDEWVAGRDKPRTPMSTCSWIEDARIESIKELAMQRMLALWGIEIRSVVDSTKSTAFGRGNTLPKSVCKERLCELLNARSPVGLPRLTHVSNRRAIGKAEEEVNDTEHFVYQVVALIVPALLQHLKVEGKADALEHITLIVDNASYHGAVASQSARKMSHMHEVLKKKAYGLNLVYTPVKKPWLNVAENAIGELKRHVRKHADTNGIIKLHRQTRIAHCSEHNTDPPKTCRCLCCLVQRRRKAVVEDPQAIAVWLEMFNYRVPDDTRWNESVKSVRQKKRNDEAARKPPPVPAGSTAGIVACNQTMPTRAGIVCVNTEGCVTARSKTGNRGLPQWHAPGDPEPTGTAPKGEAVVITTLAKEERPSPLDESTKKKIEAAIHMKEASSTELTVRERRELLREQLVLYDSVRWPGYPRFFEKNTEDVLKQRHRFVTQTAGESMDELYKKIMEQTYQHEEEEPYAGILVHLPFDHTDISDEKVHYPYAKKSSATSGVGSIRHILQTHVFKTGGTKAGRTYHNRNHKAGIYYVYPAVRWHQIAKWNEAMRKKDPSSEPPPPPRFIDQTDNSDPDDVQTLNAMHEAYNEWQKVYEFLLTDPLLRGIHIKQRWQRTFLAILDYQWNHKRSGLHPAGDVDQLAEYASPQNQHDISATQRSYGPKGDALKGGNA